MAFTERQVDKIYDAAEDLTTAEIIAILCLRGIEGAVDYQEDLMTDPAVSPEEKIPSVQDMVNLAVVQASQVIPDIVLDDDEILDQVPGQAPNSGPDVQTPFQRMVAAVSAQLIKQRPTMVRLKYQPS